MFFAAGPGILPATKAFPVKPAYAKATSSSGLSKKLDDYKLLKKLGHGSFGDVWLAEATFAGDERALVAVKAIRRSGTDHSDPCLRDELEITKFFTDLDPRLGYFPQLVESFTDENNFYIVQEFIPGGTLRDEMRRYGGRLPPLRIKFVLAQLISIIQRMHASGIMHRDIKPENILVDSLGNVVLADLGLATRFWAMRQTHVGLLPDGAIRLTRRQCGTLGYMAPEIARGCSYSFPVDMYSLGVVFFEMVFGVHPFPQYDLDEILWAQMVYHFSRPVHDLPKDTRDLMFKMMLSEPDKRMSSLSAMSHSYFSDIDDWNLVATRQYELPEKWAPPMPYIERSVIISKNVLVDKDKRPSPYGRRNVTPFDRRFVTPRRAPTAKRPIPPKCVENVHDLRCMLVNLIHVPITRRGPTPSLAEPYSPQPAKPARVEADNNSVRSVDSLEEGEILEEIEEGEIVEEHRARRIRAIAAALQAPTPAPAVDIHSRPPGLVIPSKRASSSERARISGLAVFDVTIRNMDEIGSFVGQTELLDECGIEDVEMVDGTRSRNMPVIISSPPAPARTPASNIPRRRPPAIVIPAACALPSAPPSEDGHGTVYTAFNTCYDSFISSTCPIGIEEIKLSPPQRMVPAYTFAFRAPSPSPPNFEFLPPMSFEQNHLAPSMTSGLNDTPPITPGPVTPTSSDCIARDWDYVLSIAFA